MSSLAMRKVLYRCLKFRLRRVQLEEICFQTSAAMVWRNQTDTKKKNTLNEYFFSHDCPVQGIMRYNKAMITQSLPLENFTINARLEVRSGKCMYSLIIRGDLTATKR